LIALPSANYEGAEGEFTRDEFLEEFAFRNQPGQHTILFGSTGRGKTTLLGKMLAMPGMPKSDGLITTQLGPDLALAHLGKPVKSWPPPSAILEAMILDHRDRGIPLMRRYQPLPRKPEDFVAIRRQTSRILRWMFGRKNFTLVVPDLQVVSDPKMMGLGGEIDQLVLTMRKRGSGGFFDAQAPRWIPTSCRDNTQHVLIWPTRNEDAIRTLGRIIGVDYRIITSLFKSMDYHSALWVDVTADEYFIVRSK
jgi:energy-coupling factor transporter ATP-binding protein EcfA2